MADVSLHGQSAYSDWAVQAGGPANEASTLLLANARPEFKPNSMFTWLVGMLQVLILIGFALMGVSSESKPSAANPLEQVQLYNYYVGVALMMLVGFGYLMTFLRWYGLGAVGLTLIITALGVELAVLIEPIFANGFAPVTVDLLALLHGNFAVAAILISFGGLIGKINPQQLVILVLFEVICYSFNKQIVLTKWLNIKDCGGTIIIHMFGAYYGLAASYVLGKPKNSEKEKPSTLSDITSLIGTTFLWLYWPSFVAGDIEAGTSEAQLALTQTVLALLGSTVTTFVVSHRFGDSKFRPVDIQNATLAGGVAIGAVANLPITPAGAIAIGSLAGLISTLGFAKFQSLLSQHLSLHDSCGIHNLHGMPSILGGLASVFCAAYLKNPRGDSPGAQIAGVGMTLVVAILTGAITGGVMKTVQDGAPMADDSNYWETADDFGKEV